MLILGAGGHSREVLDLLVQQSCNSSISFFDNTDTAPIRIHNTFKVIKDNAEVLKQFEIDNDFALGVGSPKIRQKLYYLMLSLGGVYKKIISESAIISKYSVVSGDVMHQVFIGSNADIGLGALINTGSQVHHEARVGAFAELSPGSILLGNSKVGNNCRIGSNATILPNIKIGKNCVVGAGAVVTKNIPENSLVAGVPAKVIKTI